MKRKTLLAIVVPVVIITGLILYSVLSGKEKDLVLETKVEFGQFEISVMVTGELQAAREIEIQAPATLRSRNLRIRSVMIQDLIPEGTVVDSGDWVASLDRSDADNTLKDIMDDLEQSESSYTRTKLDTTMQLRELRDQLINLRFGMEEAEITLEQSQYEPPATIRQAEISLEKATRSFEQAEQNYSLKVRQAQASMRESEIEMAKDQRRKVEMEEALSQFDIVAPAGGMVIYKKDWDGEKRTVGTEINTWDLTVATLPDMSSMISKTYVNEIDISRLSRGQLVRVGVDAFPEKKFNGRVVEVANIGQQLPNTDAKVLEVRIELREKDTILRPSMTTSNEIITQVLDSVLYVPLEAVHANDSLTFVYTIDRRKEIVVLGPSNENYIVVEQGLKKGERLYLSMPADEETFKYAGLELMEEINRRKAEEQHKQENLQQTGPRNGRQFRRPQGEWSPQGDYPQGQRPQGERFQGQRPQGESQGNRLRQGEDQQVTPSRMNRPAAADSVKTPTSGTNPQ
jgi:HlyD family secretion protein